VTFEAGSPRGLATRLGVVAVLGCLVVVGACGGDDGADLPLVGEIGAAVDSVEADLGGAQEYFEITASPAAVQLFVADDEGRSVTTYVYIDEELAPPSEPRSAEGFTFTGADVDFDPATVLEQVSGEVPGAVIGTFSIIATEGGPVQYGVFADSEEGGRLDITLSGDGEVLGVTPAG
jgi:hypothetical protein